MIGLQIDICISVIAYWALVAGMMLIPIQADVVVTAAGGWISLCRSLPILFVFK